jgi:hypothetical protein
VIEVTEKYFKEFLRSREARTSEALDNAITEALENVMEKDIINWFTHCCYYVSPD